MMTVSDDCISVDLKIDWTSNAEFNKSEAMKADAYGNLRFS